MDMSPFNGSLNRPLRVHIMVLMVLILVVLGALMMLVVVMMLVVLMLFVIMMLSVCLGVLMRLSSWGGFLVWSHRVRRSLVDFLQMVEQSLVRQALSELLLRGQRNKRIFDIGAIVNANRSTCELM
jgi:hypothetical protein